MKFNILDYIDTLSEYGKIIEHSTWIQATCPICKGKLKINKNPGKYGAYCCYTNSCHTEVPNPIRKLLFQPTAFNQKTAFQDYVPIKRLVDLVSPIKLTSPPATSFLTEETFSPPKQLREDGKLYTYFDYGDFNVVRLDRKLANGFRKKYLYPEYLKDGELIQGIPETLTSVPIYQARYLQESVLFLEGEKCAAIGQKLGLAAITFPTFVFSERYLDRFIYKLSNVGIKNVLYLTDNDEIGKTKGNEICKHFWKHKVAATAFNLCDLFTDYADWRGFDLYDAYKQKLITSENVTEILEIILCQVC